MAAGCRGPAAPGRGGLQALDVAEARGQARLHDAGQQVLKDDVMAAGTVTSGAL